MLKKEEKARILQDIKKYVEDTIFEQSLYMQSDEKERKDIENHIIKLANGDKALALRILRNLTNHSDLFLRNSSVGTIISRLS